MNNFLPQLSVILYTAYILFCLILGLWAANSALRNKPLGGNYWGAIWTCTGLAVIMLVVWLLRSLSGENLRWVYLLYSIFFIVVLPGTFAILRGRDDRRAAAIFAGVAIFAALSAISASDPARGIVSSLSQ
ncbi:MAG: hypothetical protein OHK0023_05990 [Anaerolineae bacterium]